MLRDPGQDRLFSDKGLTRPPRTRRLRRVPSIPAKAADPHAGHRLADHLHADHRHAGHRHGDHRHSNHHLADHLHADHRHAGHCHGGHRLADPRLPEEEQGPHAETRRSHTRRARPSTVLPPPAPSQPPRAKLLLPGTPAGCLVVWRFFKIYIFCTLWRGCVYSGGPGWGLGQTAPASGIPRPTQTPFTTLSVLMILFCWGFFFLNLNLLFFYIYC